MIDDGQEEMAVEPFYIISAFDRSKAANSGLLKQSAQT